MMSIKRFVAMSALLCLVAGPHPAAAEKEEAPWDVTDPPGEWRSVDIDTRETTWSNVDVSPDGRTIIFDMLGDIFTIPIEGGEATPIASGIAWDFQPRFSPDGTRIAFVSDRGGADAIWLMNADGSEARAVSEDEEHLAHNPSWSPDGEYIVAKKGFMSTRSIPAGEIWLFHAGGGKGLQLTERPHGPKDQKNMAEPTFSPDGRYIYFSQDTTPGRIWQYDKDSTGQIFVIQRLDRETGETEVFVSGPGGSIRPTPSPDGRYLAFVRRTPAFTSALYLKELETGLERPLYERLDRDLQETNGSQGNTTAFGWTPDSESIVFWAGGHLHRVDIRTREVVRIPVHVRSELKVRSVLRSPIDVAPDTFQTKMLRWAQMSPDGDRVVFQSLGHLYVKDLITGEQRRLTRQRDHFEYYPSFSRDGRYIVYTTWDDEELGSVRIIPATGGTGRRLTRDPGHYVEPRFSPDGRTIVYRKVAGGFVLSGQWSIAPGIYTLSIDGGEPLRISDTGFNAHYGAYDDRIFYSDTFEETKLVLKSVDTEGRDERTHLQGAKVTEFSLSPDGRWIAFTEQFNVHVAPFTPTGRSVTIGPDAKGIPVARVSGRSGEFLHWSFDSQSLHWAHGPTLFTRALNETYAFLDGAPEELPEPTEAGIDLSFTVTADRPSGQIALVGGRVVTMRDAGAIEEVFDPGVVLIKDNRIEAVGPQGSIAIPDEVFLVSTAGMTIIPGLIDVHAHGPHGRSEIIPQQNWMQYSNLAFGVTTIHDPSNDTSTIFSAAEMQRVGAIVSPRIYSTGTILYGAHYPGYTATIKNLDDALFHVRRLKDVGAISVKSYNQPRRDQRQQVIAAGDELGIMVVPEGGAKFQYNLSQIVDGHTGIEHAVPVAHVYDDVRQLWSGTAVGYTPTLGVAYGGLRGENYWYEHTDVWLNERLMRYTPRFVVEPKAIRRSMAPEQHYNHVYVARAAKGLEDAGVLVLVGAHGQREGLATHWEMWMLEQGGFSPFEALRSATIHGARYLGLDRHLGSIELGKLADLVVIEGNPLSNLRQSEHVRYTMINGRLYEASTMDQIAPETVSREAFFFEKVGGDTIHPTTQEWLQTLARSLGWVH